MKLLELLPYISVRKKKVIIDSLNRNGTTKRRLSFIPTKNLAGAIKSFKVNVNQLDVVLLDTKNGILRIIVTNWSTRNYSVDTVMKDKLTLQDILDYVGTKTKLMIHAPTSMRNKKKFAKGNFHALNKATMEDYLAKADIDANEIEPICVKGNGGKIVIDVDGGDFSKWRF